jgi:hypothetical protein
MKPRKKKKERKTKKGRKKNFYIPATKIIRRLQTYHFSSIKNMKYIIINPTKIL